MPGAAASEEGLPGGTLVVRASLAGLGGFAMHRLLLLAVAASCLAPVGCAGSTPSPVVVTSTPQIIYVTSTPTPGPTEVATPAPTEIAAPTPTPPPKVSQPPIVQFADGTWQVGKDVQPGTYRTRKASNTCIWKRLSGFGGTYTDTIASDLTNAPVVVTIAATDKGFQSERCGTWTTDLSAITTSQTTFGEGIYIVGTDIVAGTYKNSGGQTCIWKRLSGFGGTYEDTITGDLTTVSAIVTISPNDKGFDSAFCGTWTKL